MPELAMQQHGYTKEETTQEILDASEEKPHMVLRDAGEMIPML